MAWLGFSFQRWIRKGRPSKHAGGMFAGPWLFRRKANPPSPTITEITFVYQGRGDFFVVLVLALQRQKCLMFLLLKVVFNIFNYYIDKTYKICYLVS